MSTVCNTCKSISNSPFWVPITDAVQSSQFPLDYFYNLEPLQSTLKGSHYFENACLINSDDGALCTTEFYMFSIEQATPLLYIAGDGYLGLGLSSPGHTDKDSFNFNTLGQMKQHGMIDKLQFGIHTVMTSDVDQDSQIRFGGWNENFASSQFEWINTSDSNTWKIPL